MMELLQSFFTVNKEKIIFSCLTLPSKWFASHNN
jgi:hypothetical protein